MFEWLLDRSMGPPGPDGNWPSWMTFLFHASNFFTAMALIFVPIVVVGKFRRKRKGLRPAEWWILLSMFPVLAAGRAMRFAEFMGVPYRLTTLIDAAGAVVSILAVFQLPRIGEHIAMLPSRDDVHEIREAWNKERIEMAAERLAMRENYRRLALKIDALEVTVLDGGWCDDVHHAIREMHAILAQIGGTDDGN